ncbi:hypothetical protein HDU89_004142 [Geranomyces variabilis]|nr:hypothetical protein HDU89_004142 [Geranomyces variabilis]
MPKTATNKRLLFIIATLLIPAVSVSSAPVKIDPAFARFRGSSPSLATPSPSAATPSSAASSSSIINLIPPTIGGSSHVLHQRHDGPHESHPRHQERRMSMPAVSVVAVSGANPLLRRDGEPETVVIISGDAEESYADTVEGGMVVIDGR